MTRALCFMFALICLTGCEKKRTPARYLIPADYEGVVITVFGQPGFPTLPTKDGFRVHDYPDDGVLITSSAQEFGWASDETLDVLKDGTFRRISSGNVVDRREHFSASGSQEGGGEPKIEYAFKVIGSVKYWDSIDATEYDRKKEEAVQKLKPLQKPKTKNQTANKRKLATTSRAESLVWIRRFDRVVSGQSELVRHHAVWVASS